MIARYLASALASARYGTIRDEEPWYGEIPELCGVWATGRSEAECRARLSEALDGWLIVHLRLGLAVPPVGGINLDQEGVDTGRGP